MKILITFLSLAFFSSDFVKKEGCHATYEKQMAEEILIDNIDVFEYLEETRMALEEEVDGLSEEQMSYQASDDSWSVAEIVEHVIIVEGALKSMLEARINSGETLDQKEEVKMTDEEVVGFITDRSGTIQTQDQFQPSGKFSSSEEALEAFEDQRENIVEWLKESDADMRNYVNEFPFGKIDAYQTVLFMAGHTARHTAQIEELKSNPEFP
ncbi:DinB family protein [Christiangramia sabulilitoris]|uniref:DinB family protein n=1 Tax=Christiangramia sabulilitoris TaxID=2583991 RepID=A0A550I6B6_9FLAO|nr:DinB family protein [Christiangramia sabulilitoris]TRO66501.1 DinB family protein [Christiangramia sabulilitoris]